MSSLEYTNEDGPGKEISNNYHFSQAVRIGDIIKCAGQSGRDPSGALDMHDLKSQIHCAFQNVDNVLRAAGSRGWEDVYLVRTYATHMELAMGLLVAKLKERIPYHKPVWTALGVPRLALKEMLVEIEVEAYSPRD